jgi:hypothetical protein
VTTHPGKRPTSEQIAQLAEVLEHLLPPGYSLAHTRGWWYLKSWDSWIQHGHRAWAGVTSTTHATWSQLLERIAHA